MITIFIINIIVIATFGYSSTIRTIAIILIIFLLSLVWAKVDDNHLNHLNHLLAHVWAKVDGRWRERKEKWHSVNSWNNNSDNVAKKCSENSWKWHACFTEERWKIITWQIVNSIWHVYETSKSIHKDILQEHVLSKLGIVRGGLYSNPRKHIFLWIWYFVQRPT